MHFSHPRLTEKSSPCAWLPNFGGNDSAIRFPRTTPHYPGIAIKPFATHPGRRYLINELKKTRTEAGRITLYGLKSANQPLLRQQSGLNILRYLHNV
jgi:hypothetical protein